MESIPGVPRSRLEILDGGEVIAAITAQRRRIDLERAGFGDGRHVVLIFRIGSILASGMRSWVRRAADGFLLSPIATAATDAVMVADASLNRMGES